MKNSQYYLFLVLLVFCNMSVFAQEEKPKVALVLSGGGAMGIAHIPLLQTLDSLGIVPDLLIGTSMGSVIGGFYASGYSGDSISYIAHHADWSELLGGDITLDDVSMEEKSEFKRHLVDFDIVKGKPKVNSGLLKDQKLREFLFTYTFPVYNITNFDDLPIPYRAMTTDIVNGKEYLFENGSLALAMRASMSIPGVFQPIPYDNTLLVDGGVLNNFPVDVAHDMGYDFIIGSDVGGGMQAKDKLDNIPALLFQAAMLTSNLKSPENRALCNILIDHVPNLTYTPGDFAKSDEIYLEGKPAVVKNMDALVALADRLKKYKQRSHQVPDVSDEFLIDTVAYSGVSDANLELVKARAKIESGVTYSTDEVIFGIDRAMGTNLFNEITFDAEMDNDELQFNINGFERSRNVIKGSLHYDNYRSVGVMVNYTGRNILGNASRFLVTVDIAVQPRFRVQYQKLFGEDKNWWWRSEVLGEFLKQTFYVSGEVADNMNSDYLLFDNEMNKNFNSFYSYTGIGVTVDNSWIKPQVNPKINDNVLNLKRYTFFNFEIDAHYEYNKMDKVYYPNKGLFSRLEVARSLVHDVDIQWADDTFQDEKGSTNGFTKFKFDMEKRWAFSDKVTGILGANAAFIFMDEISSDQLSFSDYGYSAQYALGGTIQGPRRNTYTFAGLHEDELVVTQFMRLNFGAQINPFSKFYFTPHVNLATVGFNNFNNYIEDAFSPNGQWTYATETSSIISTGINFGYHSFLGPVNFDVSYVNDIDQVRVFFNIGILFNRSN